MWKRRDLVERQLPNGATQSRDRRGYLRRPRRASNRISRKICGCGKLCGFATCPLWRNAHNAPLEDSPWTRADERQPRGSQIFVLRRNVGS